MKKCLLTSENVFLFDIRVHVYHPGQASVGGPQRTGGAMHDGRCEHLPDRPVGPLAG